MKRSNKRKMKKLLKKVKDITITKNQQIAYLIYAELMEECFVVPAFKDSREQFLKGEKVIQKKGEDRFIAFFESLSRYELAQFAPYLNLEEDIKVLQCQYFREKGYPEDFIHFVIQGGKK